MSCYIDTRASSSLSSLLSPEPNCFLPVREETSRAPNPPTVVVVDVDLASWLPCHHQRHRHNPHLSGNRRSPQLRYHGRARRCQYLLFTSSMSFANRSSWPCLRLLHPPQPPSYRFNIYIYDYCFKRGFRKTARELLHEAEIPPEATPPINARQGLLFEYVSLLRSHRPITY